MSERRIAKRFAAAGESKLLIPYITAGDPDLDTTLALMHTLVKAGADVIELGIPFSDPMADGPVIQAACERALKNKVSLVQVMDTVKRFRETDNDTAVVLMGYMNPVERLGYAKFAEAAAQSGVDGVLTVDMPPEEAKELVEELSSRELDCVFLLSPTTPDARMQQVFNMASGYIYYVSLKGVTGAANLDTDAVATKVNHIKSQTSIPVAVGFGIRDAQSAAAISQAADGVVVGSVLVSIVGEHGQDKDKMHKTLFTMVNGMRSAMDDIQVTA